MGGELREIVAMRKVNLGDGQPHAVIDTAIFSPLDAVFWMVFAHYGVYSPNPDRIAWGSAEHPITPANDMTCDRGGVG